MVQSESSIRTRALLRNAHVRGARVDVVTRLWSSINEHVYMQLHLHYQFLLQRGQYINGNSALTRAQQK